MAAKLAFHEGKACDAVIRRIERRERGERRNISFPERDGHAAPIELACEIGGKLFAFEHTGIEPFAGHMQLDAQADRYLKPIETMLAGALPPDERFVLRIPVNAMQDRNGGEIRRIQQALVEWIKQVAPSLSIARPGRYFSSSVALSPPGVPFPVSLHRSDPGNFPGRFVIACDAPSDLEQERLARVSTAYERKSPKLAAWKRELGAHTILVFEENDVFITNQELIADAVEQAEQRIHDKPDEVWLVSTAIDKSWDIWWLRIGDRYCDNLSYWGESLSDVDPQTLVNVTGR